MEFFEMSLILADANVVVAAKVFNPSITNQLWLFQNDIIGDEKLKKFVFTEVLSQVQTDDFRLVIVPQRLQFIADVEEELQQALIVEKVSKIIEALPHTPFLACGLNITWYLEPEHADAPTICRRLFYKEDTPLSEIMNSDDALFGGYFSKNFHESRLKVDVKPIDAEKENDQKVQLLQFSFNFHKDVENSEHKITDIETLLRHWDEALARTQEIMFTANRSDTP